MNCIFTCFNTLCEDRVNILKKVVFAIHKRMKKLLEISNDIIEDISDPTLRCYVKKKFNEEYSLDLGKTIIDVIFDQINGRVGLVPVGYEDYSKKIDEDEDEDEPLIRLVPATTLIRAKKALIEAASDYKSEYRQHEKELMAGGSSFLFKG